jgi:ribonuclease-3
LKSILEFEEQLGYRFSNQELLSDVLIRRAAVGEGLAVSDFSRFEQLKFLGSRVLHLIVADILLEIKLHADEGKLTQLTEKFVNHHGLIIKAAKKIDLGRFLIMGRGEQLNSIEGNDRVLYKHMEALFAAVWIDSKKNYTLVKNLFLQMLDLDIEILRIFSAPVRIEIEQYSVKESDLICLQAKIDYQFNDHNFLLSALIRQSAIEEKVVEGTLDSFQAMEFLGDKILGCAIAEILLHRYPNLTSGELTTLLSKYTHNKGPLANAARQIRLGRLLLMGNGEQMLGLRNDTKVLSDHLEAFLAALWLDSARDFAKVKTIIEDLWQPLIHADESAVKLPAVMTETEYAKHFPMPLWELTNEVTTNLMAKVAVGDYKAALCREVVVPKRKKHYPALWLSSVTTLPSSMPHFSIPVSKGSTTTIRAKSAVRFESLNIKSLEQFPKLLEK